MGVGMEGMMETHMVRDGELTSLLESLSQTRLHRGDVIGKKGWEQIVDCLTCHLTSLVFYFFSVGCV